MAERVIRRADERVDLIRPADMTRDRERPASLRLDLGRDVLAVVEFAAGDDHVGARVGEAQRDRLPEAAATTGDDRRFSREVEEIPARHVGNLTLGLMAEDRLYFRQLLAGRDFVADDQIAEQMVNFVYLVGDRETGEAVAIDPAYGVRELVDLLGADGMHLTDVLVTHYHPDHVGGDLGGWRIEGLAELLALPDVHAKVHVQSEEAFGVKRVTGASDSTSCSTRRATSCTRARSRSR